MCVRCHAFCTAHLLIEIVCDPPSRHLCGGAWPCLCRSSTIYPATCPVSLFLCVDTQTGPLLDPWPCVAVRTGGFPALSVFALALLGWKSRVATDVTDTPPSKPLPDAPTDGCRTRGPPPEAPSTRTMHLSCVFSEHKKKSFCSVSNVRVGFACFALVPPPFETLSKRCEARFSYDRPSEGLHEGTPRCRPCFTVFCHAFYRLRRCRRFGACCIKECVARCSCRP